MLGTAEGSKGLAWMPQASLGLCFSTDGEDATLVLGSLDFVVFFLVSGTISFGQITRGKVDAA